MATSSSRVHPVFELYLVKSSMEFRRWISNYKKVSLGPVDRSFSKNTLEILQTKVCFSVSSKHIRSALSRRHGSVKQNSATIPEYSKAEGGGVVLDTSFGDEFGRAHFGYTPTVKFKKGDNKGLQVAVKVIPKPKSQSKAALTFTSGTSRHRIMKKKLNATHEVLSKL
ncbi:hypothetical protein Bca4012_048066 [Brassica carinata]|uniref:(rape) hypothetical protein n=1 Tax=Brassica napus TaxID=3708 RepID=A0A816KB69_BRANA|nr:unnamed protein product [Brassica napus]